MSPTLARYKYLTEKFSKKGFRWDYTWFNDVDAKLLNVSFESEWDKLISCVFNITGILRNESVQDMSPWEKYFQHVINPAAANGVYDIRMHENEHTFSDTLFEALRTALQEFVDPDMYGRNTIVLKNSHIGFGKGIPRKNLGLGGGHYLVSIDGRSQHCCFVFGSRSKLRQTSDEMDDEKEFLYDDDMTASIELKQDTKMCCMFHVYSPPSLGSEESINRQIVRCLLGQAMIFSWDVLHCLARRGIRANSVPVAVLAGTTEWSEDYQKKVRCLDARIETPVRIGCEFSCLFNQLVSFNGTVAVPNQRDCASAKMAIDDALAVDSSEATKTTASFSGDKLAIAIYIKTMRVGLEHAYKISKNRTDRNALFPPVSLCCQSLLDANVEAQLLAMSIPNANRFQVSNIKVYQGEMFSLVSPTKDDFYMSMSMKWFVGAKNNEILTKDCLVKVSSADFHITYVRHEECYWALNALHEDCFRKKNTKLKQELTKVLLGFGHRYTRSLCMVMKDLRSEGFTVLDHQQLRCDGKLPELWCALSDLVKSLLLPMANEDVIHVDIRSTSTVTYNILCRAYSSNAIELRLIDYDSLTCSSTSYSYRDFAHQKDAIHLDDIGFYDRKNDQRKDGALRYLFWQVLWIAYTWHPKSASAAVGDSSRDLSAQQFVSSFSKDACAMEFKDWLGNVVVKALQSMNDEIISEAAVIAALDVLGKAFCEREHQVVTS